MTGRAPPIMQALGRSIRHWAEALPLILLQALLRRLPWRAVSALGAALGGLAFALGFRRAETLGTLRMAWGDPDPAEVKRIARGAYRFFGSMGFEFLAMPALGPRRIGALAALHDLPLLRQALAQGKGALLITGHLGNWELIAGALHAAGIPFSGYAGRQHNPVVDDLINRARRAVGHEPIGKGPGTRAVFKALKANRAMAMVADQHDSKKRYYVSFFGRPVSAAPGPALIARRTGAPAFFICCAREADGRYGCRLEPLPVPVTEDEERDLLMTTQAFFDALEAAVREYPEQYFWMHRRWRPMDARVRLTPANRAFLARRLPESALPPG